MLRVDGDQTNWVLVIILVAMALLLAMVSSSVSGDVPRVGLIETERTSEVLVQERKEIRTASEAWYVARELYQAGKLEESSRMFERVTAAYPYDAGARMWAGMIAFRRGDRAAAARHWNAVWCDDEPVSECGVWPAVALTAAELKLGRPDRAARFIVPLERGDYGFEFADHPIVSLYAAFVYEELAIGAPKYREAVEESLAEKFSPPLAASDGSQMVSPNSQSWLIFLTKRALQRTIRGARSLDWAAPVVPESATVEPSFAPTVEQLLECLGSADFALQARRKLRAIDLYESPPNRKFDIFIDPEWIKRGRFIAQSGLGQR
jgi:hypothetical protein